MEQPLTTGHSQRVVVDERGVKVDRVTQSARKQVGGYRERVTGTDGKCGEEPLERDVTKERRNAERIESVRDDANERERTNWTTEKSKQTTRRRRKRGVEGEDFIRERSRDGLGEHERRPRKRRGGARRLLARRRRQRRIVRRVREYHDQSLAIVIRTSVEQRRRA